VWLPELRDLLHSKQPEASGRAIGFERREVWLPELRDLLPANNGALESSVLCLWASHGPIRELRNPLQSGRIAPDDHACGLAPSRSGTGETMMRIAQVNPRVFHDRVDWQWRNSKDVTRE